MANRFAGLTLRGWQQFENVDIDFHEHLTVLTGANGSGKTTILNLLGRHADWTVPALATPQLSRFKDAITYVIRFLGVGSPQTNTIGAIKYSEGADCRLTVPQGNTASYNVGLENRQPVPCFVVPSHRSVYRYRPLSAIPAARQDKTFAFNRVWGSTRNRYLSGGGEEPSSYHMKETLIAWSIFGRGNQDMVPDLELAQFYEQFQDVLRSLLPTEIGFKGFSIRNLEVVLECKTGDFMIDGASGGLSTIIDLAWQVFMYQTAEHSQFSVLIDEVENHLHPTMQRRLLSDLIAAFPTVQFIVSTHAPLMVTSHRDSAVYVLRHREERVCSQELDFVDRAATATEVLNEALGVETTYPVWAEEVMRTALSRFTAAEITKDSVVQLKAELNAAGLGNLIPETLLRAADHDQT